MKYPAYILGFEKKPTLRNFLKYPFAFAIHFFTKSKINHIGDNYHYQDCGTLINHSTGRGFQSENYERILLNKDSNVYAYPIIFDIDLVKLHKDTLDMRGANYDFSSTVNTKLSKWPIIGKYFKIGKYDDDDYFCNESALYRCFQQQGHLTDLNKNAFDPQEFIDLGIKHKLISPKRIHVWNGKQMLSNIFKR